MTSYVFLNRIILHQGGSACAALKKAKIPFYEDTQYIYIQPEVNGEYSQAEPAIRKYIEDLTKEKDVAEKVSFPAAVFEKIPKWRIRDKPLQAMISKAYAPEHKERSRKTEENIELLAAGDIKRKNLNQGIHDGAWYFGKIVLYRGDHKDAIITSDRHFLVNKTERIKGIVIGENEISAAGFEYHGNLEETKNMWSSKSVEEWLRGSHAPCYKQEVYASIRAQIEKYMELQDPAEYDLVACFILGTYCYELFESYPILFLNALMESGKSKLMKLIRLMSFNGEEASSITEAAFFRSIEATKGTLCIDEYEKEKEDSDRRKMTDQLLNAGIEKGAGVKRVEKEKGRLRLRRFDVYCPKVVCAISSIRDTTFSRCIPIRLLRTTSEKGNRKPRENGEEWQGIRDSCYVLVLENWKEIHSISDSFRGRDKSGRIQDRKKDLWDPILSMAWFVDVKVHAIVEAYALKNIQENAVDVFEDNWDFQLLDCMAANVGAPGYYATTTITEWLSLRLEVPKPPRPTWVGRRLKMHQFQNRRIGKGTEYFLSEEVIADRIKRRYGELEERKEEAVHTHTTVITPTTPITPTTLKDSVRSVRSVGSAVPPGPLQHTQKRQIRDGLLDLVKLNELQGEETSLEDLKANGATDDDIKELRTKGMIYESRPGFFRGGGAL